MAKSASPASRPASPSGGPGASKPGVAKPAVIRHGSPPRSPVAGETLQAREKEELERAERYAHYADMLHKTAEKTETFFKAAEHSRAIDAAFKHVKTVGQMAYDVRRVKRGIVKLNRVATEGGRAGERARASLQKSLKAAHDLEMQFARERALSGASLKVIQEYKALLRTGMVGAAKARMAEFAKRLEATLEKSTVGQNLVKKGKVFANPHVVRGLFIVKWSMSAWESVESSYVHSNMDTTAGKVVNTALDIGGKVLVDRNPVVGFVDESILPKGYKLSEIYHGGASAVTAIGEGLLRNDSRAMDRFHEKSMHGAYGKILQASSEAGVFWAEKGVVGGMDEFVDSVRWWVSH